MKCIVCQREDIRKIDVKEEIKIGKEIVYLPINIPVCTTCGERYYDRKTIRYLENEEQKLKMGNDIISRIEQKWEGYAGIFRKRKNATVETEANTKIIVDTISRIEQKWERFVGFFRNGKKANVEAEAKAKAEAEAKEKEKAEVEAKAETEAEAKLKAFNWQLTPSDWLKAEAKVKAEAEAKALAKAESKMEVDTLSCI